MRRERSWKAVLILMAFPLLSFHSLYSQCTASAPAVASCSGTLLSNNANINSGNYYWPAATTGSVSNINLNGGTIRVCGTLSISNLNFNSGNIIVESTGSLTLNNSVNMNGSIANRGKIAVSGSVTMQGGSSSTLWNEASASSFSLTGTLTINSGALINKSYISTSAFVIQGGTVCMQDNAIIASSSLTNNITNGVVYSGTSSNSACISVSTSATLNSALTGSSNIIVCKSSSVTNTSGWGSASVFPNCTNCNVPLPLYIESFTGINAGNKIVLSWKTGGNFTNEVFDIEESDDGVNFHEIDLVNARQNINSYSADDDDIHTPLQFYRIKLAFQNGMSVYSPVINVKTGFQSKLLIFPNPAMKNGKLTIAVNHQGAENIQLSLIDLSGKILSVKNEPAASGSVTVSFDLMNVASGTYILKIRSDASGYVYTKILVLP